MDKTKKQQDLEDYNHATSGLNVGRNHGFATPEYATAERVDSDNADANFDIAFAMLMEAEEQRRIAFEQQLNDLKDRYAELDRASLASLIDAEENLNDIQDRANRSIDGRRIYLDQEDQNHYDEAGNLIRNENIDWDTYDANAPDRQSWQNSSDRFQEVKRIRDEVVELNPDSIEAGDFEALNAHSEKFDELESSIDNIGTSQYRTTSAAVQKGSLSSTVFFDINTFPFRALVDEEDWLRTA